MIKPSEFPKYVLEYINPGSEYEQRVPVKISGRYVQVSFTKKVDYRFYIHICFSYDLRVNFLANMPPGMFISIESRESRDFGVEYAFEINLLYFSRSNSLGYSIEKGEIKELWVDINSENELIEILQEADQNLNQIQ